MISTTAKIIANKLHQSGCRHAFGMPGGEVLVVMQALAEAGIQFDLVKHENAAGFMAEGTWHATGAPGILLTTIGPGLANGLNSVANAFQEQVPLIVLSGCIEDWEAQSFTHQVIDQSALLKPITKAQFQVKAESVEKIMDKAMAIALADPPGPVHIDVPHNVAALKVEVKNSHLPDAKPAAWPEGEDLENARKMLEHSRRPIIVAGLGALHHKAGTQLLRLCDERSIPIVTTYKAKGIVDENHALCLGGHGLSPLSDTIILPLLAESDCIILAGYDPIEMRSGWIEPWDPKYAIDIMHADVQHGMFGANIRFVGDVADGLAKLQNDLPKSSENWVGGEIKTAKVALEQMFASREEWGPHKVFSTVQDHLPAGGVATVDSGAHRILVSQMWKCSKPQKMLQSTAFCTMGVAIPLAIGFKRAANAISTSQQSNHVVVFVGDAGLEMVMGELATLRELGLAVTIIVTVDNSLSLIELKQSRSDLPNLGVDFGSTDIVAVAKAYGGNAHWVEDEMVLQRELDNAFTSQVFTLLACRIDKKHYSGAF